MTIKATKIIIFIIIALTFSCLAGCQSADNNICKLATRETSMTDDIYRQLESKDELMLLFGDNAMYPLIDKGAQFSARYKTIDYDKRKDKEFDPYILSYGYIYENIILHCCHDKILDLDIDFEQELVNQNEWLYTLISYRGINLYFFTLLEENMIQCYFYYDNLYYLVIYTSDTVNGQNEGSPIIDFIYEMIDDYFLRNNIIN